MRRLIAIVFLLLYGSVVQASDLDLSCERYSAIYIKTKEGSKIFRAILKVESNDGVFLVGDVDPSFGTSQMKVAAVKDAAQYWGIKIPAEDDKIIWWLLKDKNFSVKMGAAYYGMLLQKFKDPYISAIAYNVGLGVTLRLQKEKKPLPITYIIKIKRAINP